MFKTLAKSVYEDTRELLGTPQRPCEYMLFAKVFDRLYQSREAEL